MQVRPLFSGLCGQPTARALCFAGAVLAVTPAWAKPIDYDIPAGTLAAALSQLAAASGVMITFSSEQTAGLSSPGLHGSYEVEQGFAHVLQGSGLRIVQAGEKRFVLASMEAGGALQLGATTIDAAGLGAITEGTGAYTTGATNAATKLALSLRETPQTVSVMTRQRMEDQQLTTLSDVLKQTPGLSVQNIDSERVNIYSRGYALDSYQFDGIPTTLIVQTSASPQSLIDTSVYDRVEVVRGATGLMTGAGDPSGSVNLVRKRPTAGFQGSVSAGAGSWDTYRTEVDVSGPLTTDARLRGRAVMAYQQGNSFIDHYQQEKQTYYGILEADLTDSTLLTVGFDYQKNDPRGVSFASFPLFYSDGGQTDFPRSINAGARWSYRQQNTLNTFATLEHGLANDWKLKVAVNNMYSTRDYSLASLSGGAPDRETGEGAYLYGGDGYGSQRQLGLDAMAQGPLQFLGREHELVLGLSASQFKDYSDPDDDDLEMRPANIHSWDNDTERPTSVGKLMNDDTTIRQDAAYMVARFKPADDLSLIVGARVGDYSYKKKAIYNPPYTRSSSTAESRESGFITPYAGVVYDLNDIHSVYASYTTIYKPQALREQNGRNLEPREGDNYEVGLKSEFFDGRVNTAIALYEIKQDNLGVPTGETVEGTVRESAYRAVAGAKTRGIDMEIFGEVLPDWNVSASYSHSVTKDADHERIRTEAPANLIKLWTTYRLQGGLNPLTIGGGLNWQSGMSLTTSQGKATQEQYAVFNVMARYDITRQLSASVNVNNVFDKQYFSALDPTFFTGYYGEPRNVMFSTRYAF
ncbi:MULTISPECIES: TonB-dependent siderophore receptor [Pseudomonas]|uniref:TonB-dependent siderophore receptor n=1 Tax=Pseudomonas TaxID=286 RepID=UPI00137AC3E4|nr:MULTISPECIES: TonB-dependent receptor [Pseudomonas]WBM30495.1 TonB-dependent receptor [Pseudomonas sp. NY11382]